MTVHFGRAAFELVDLVALVPPERLGGPGLGEWTLRELIGHTSRALSTVVAYLAEPAPLETTVHSASEYLEVVLRQRGDDAAIASRGRESAEMLGDDAIGAVADLAAASVEAVDRAGLDRLVSIGDPSDAIAMRLGEYLRTRVFELTVHGLDIADAAGLEWRPPLAHVLDALHLAAGNASARGMGEEALRYLTGRRPDAGLEGVMRAGR
ncbi:MAG: maleylpyruvate isomerase N-terminal domain-containing protein [Actinomycetota bacterium]